MSSALTYIILGTAYFIGAQSVPYTAPGTIQARLQLRVTQYNYTYTLGIGTYKVHGELKNWNEARRTCQEEGAHLAIVNSIIEAQTIGNLLGKYNLEWAHIGFHDLFQEGEYVTVHGESLAKAGYEGWHTGEPNNWDDNEDCGVLWTDGTLNDGRCEHRHNFICELPQAQLCATQYQQSSESGPVVELINPVKSN